MSRTGRQMAQGQSHDDAAQQYQRLSTIPRTERRSCSAHKDHTMPSSANEVKAPVKLGEPFQPLRLVVYGHNGAHKILIPEVPGLGATSRWAP